MGADAVEFRHRHPDVFGPFRDLDAGQPLYGSGVRPVPGHGVQIVHPAHVGHELHVGLLLGHPLVHAVDVAEDGLGPQDVLPFEFQHDAQNTMC